MNPMAKRKVTLKYPEHLIKEPVLFQMAKEFDVMPNIRRARVTDTLGEIFLELEGAPENLTRGIEYLKRVGVEVDPVEGDIVE
jgi:ABC-type methionine transport system ATPase subunit